MAAPVRTLRARRSGWDPRPPAVRQTEDRVRRVLTDQPEWRMARSALRRALTSARQRAAYDERIEKSMMEDSLIQVLPSDRGQEVVWQGW
jgi:hypothetical protein